MRFGASMLLVVSLLFLPIWTASAAPPLVDNPQCDVNNDGVIDFRDMHHMTTNAIFGNGTRPTYETLKYDINFDFTLDVEDIRDLLHCIVEEIGDPEPTDIVTCELGDLNLENGVDIDDFDLLVEYFLDAITLSINISYYKGDLNGDGFVDEADYDLLAEGWTADGQAPEWPFPSGGGGGGGGTGGGGGPGQ